VLRGFSFGLALVIAVKQWPHIVGMQVHSADFLPMLLEIIRGVGAWRPIGLATGVCALAALFALERVRYVPGMLLVIVAGIAAAPWLAAHGVVLTGPIHLTLERPSFAMPPGERWLPLVEFALALMFILYAESYSSIRTFALKHDEIVRPNRDLIALGIANVVSGAFHGTPVGAGYSGTSANEAAGAGSRAAGLYAAVTVLALVVLFLPWIERIPDPILAAIVIHAVSKSLRLAVFRPYFKWRRDRLENYLRHITAYELQLMGGPPFHQYTFFFHIGPYSEAGGGGMEHADCTAIGSSSIESAITTAAHEFFHAWNVKRIRPQTLEPVDFTKEQYTRALWFAEGVTNTYASYTLLRSGIWPKERFYADLAAQISELDSRPAQPGLALGRPRRHDRIRGLHGVDHVRREQQRHVLLGELPCRPARFGRHLQIGIFSERFFKEAFLSGVQTSNPLDQACAGAAGTTFGLRAREARFSAGG